MHLYIIIIFIITTVFIIIVFYLQLSWADLYFVSAVSSLNFMAKSNILEGRPKLQELNEKVLELPQIKSWMEKRTKCPY